MIESGDLPTGRQVNRLGDARSMTGISRIRTQRSGEILPLSRLNVNVFTGPAIGGAGAGHVARGILLQPKLCVGQTGR